MLTHTKTTLLLGLVVCLIGASAAVGVEYWISPTGDDDAGDGTMGNPWRSPSRGAGLRAAGAAGIGAMAIEVRNTEGFLHTGGNLKIGTNTVAYSSIDRVLNNPNDENDLSEVNGTVFNLAAPLSFEVNLDDLINDADILGGNGFQPGDIINLRGGTYEQDTLRLKASGSNLGGDITYRSAPGELAFLNNANRHKDTTRGGIWNDGEGVDTKTEFVRLENFRVKMDQNFGCNSCSSGVILKGSNSITIDGMNIESTGSTGDQTRAVHVVKGSSVAIQNSILRSKFTDGLRHDLTGSTSISDTVIWGSELGINVQNQSSPTGGPTVTANNVTIFGGLTVESDLWAANVGSGESTLTITDSIISGHPDPIFVGLRPALNLESFPATGTSDFTLFHNIGNNNYYGPAWGLLGADDMPGANGQPGVDPQFIETVDTDSPNWLRFLETSPAATASSTGSYVGAFAPVSSTGPDCDFSSDSLCDDVDIDLLAAAVRNGTSDSKFNVDGLGDANIPDDADFDFYITDDSMLSTGLGDHDLNMMVNFNDFVRLSNDFGGIGTGWGEGNGNTDNFTNFNDFVRLSNNFGMSFLASDGANVPEPAALAILAIGALAVAGRPRSGSRN